MASVGDRVTVTISDAILSGTIDIARGSSMSVPGKIIQDLGTNWLIQLDISVDGKNQIVVPKTAQVQA